MSNLLPDEQKKIVSQAYFFRVVTIALLFVTLCFSFALASLLPAYFSTTYKLARIEDEVKELQTIVSETKKSELLVASMKDINSKLEVVEKWSKEGPAYKKILKVLEERAVGIALTTMQYSRKNASIELVGTAREREDLLNFKTALEKSGKFLAVLLPVSNLAQKEDVDFTITITFAKP